MNRSIQKIAIVFVLLLASASHADPLDLEDYYSIIVKDPKNSLVPIEHVKVVSPKLGAQFQSKDGIKFNLPEGLQGQSRESPPGFIVRLRAEGVEEPVGWVTIIPALSENGTLLEWLESLFPGIDGNGPIELQATIDRYGSCLEMVTAWGKITPEIIDAAVPEKKKLLMYEFVWGRFDFWSGRIDYRRDSKQWRWVGGRAVGSFNRLSGIVFSKDGLPRYNLNVGLNKEVNGVNMVDLIDAVLSSLEVEHLPKAAPEPQT